MSQPATKIEPVFWFMEPDDLDEIDLKNLSNALTRDYTGTTLEQLLEGARAHTNQIFRLQAGDIRGAFATEIIQTKGGLELLIWLMGGKGLVPYPGCIVERLEEFAKSQDCKWMRCLCVPGVSRFLLANSEFKLTHHNLVKEI